jgi:hypothetical protein
MKSKKISFRTVLAIVAIAVMGVVFTGCSKDDDILADVEQSDVNATAKISRLKSSKAAIVAGITYTSYFKRHYGEAYPGYVTASLDFSSNQLAGEITPTEETDSTAAFSLGDFLTFFNQTAYKSGSPKGCPAFIINDDYEVANYTAEVPAELGYDSLYTLTKNEIENADLTYVTDDDDFKLPFLKSEKDPSFFSGGNLLQSEAYDFYDDSLRIGRKFHVECGGGYTTPIWIIRIRIGHIYIYWAFCIDPYQNGTTGGAGSPSPSSNKWWSTFNYKKLN